MVDMVFDEDEGRVIWVIRDYEPRDEPWYQSGLITLSELLRNRPALPDRPEDINPGVSYPRDCWNRLPDSLISSLCTTMPENGVQISLQEPPINPKFTSALVLRRQRVLNHSLIVTLMICRQTLGHPSEMANHAKVFYHLGASLEKIVMRYNSHLWPLLLLAFIYSRKLRRIELHGPLECPLTLHAMCHFKELAKGWPLRELVIGNHIDEWPDKDIAELKSFLVHVSSELSALCLSPMEPMTFDDGEIANIAAMNRLRSLDLGIHEEEEWWQYQNCYLPAIASQSLTSFRIEYSFGVYDLADADVVALFRHLGAMTSLRKFMLAVTLNDFDRLRNKRWAQRREALLTEAAVEHLPKLTNLQVLHLSVLQAKKFGKRTLAALAPFDYRFWLCLFQYNVKSVRKLIIDVPSWISPADDAYLELDFVVRPFAQLESLIVNLANINRPGSLKKERIFNEFVKMGEDQKRANICSKIKTLTLRQVPRLDKQILPNISFVLPGLVELNIDGGQFECYKKKNKILKAVVSSVVAMARSLVGSNRDKQEDKDKAEEVDPFDSGMAELIDKLKSLRVLRFLDNYTKNVTKVVTAMCKRASSKNAATKKMLLRVPLTEQNRAALEKTPEVMALMAETHQQIEIY